MLRDQPTEKCGETQTQSDAWRKGLRQRGRKDALPSIQAAIARRNRAEPKNFLMDASQDRYH
jgi:hypothetical protein